MGVEKRLSSWLLEVTTRWKSPEGHCTALRPAAPLKGPTDTSKIRGSPVSEPGLVVTWVSSFLFSVFYRIK